MSVGLAGNLRRRAVKAPVNPLDVSTVFSIFPLKIKEPKYTLDPGIFEIKEGRPDAPSRLVVHPCSWWKEVDPDEPLIEIPQSSVVIAQSIVRDYCNGIVLCDMGDHMPGLFFLPGELTIKEMKEKHAEQFAGVVTKQNNWFRALVRMADSLWARSQRNPLAVPELCRVAAKSLDLKDREWLGDFKVEDLQPCPACGTLRNNNFPVCNNCKVVVDTKKFTDLGLKFAS